MIAIGIFLILTLIWICATLHEISLSLAVIAKGIAIQIPNPINVRLAGLK